MPGDVFDGGDRLVVKVIRDSKAKHHNKDQQGRYHAHHPKSPEMHTERKIKLIFYHAV